MVSQTLRSGWLIATLAFFLVVTSFTQTAPRAIVSWDPIPDPRAVKYRIQTTVGTLPFATALDCTLPPCTVTGIEGTITYKIRVAGLEADGTQGEYSTEIPFLFAAIQPLSPTSLSVSNATSTQPGKLAKKLSWTAVTKYRPGPLFPAGVKVTYRVYQGETAPTVLVTETSTNTFTVQGLAKHKSFQFWVTCVIDTIGYPTILVESFTSPAVRVNT